MRLVVTAREVIIAAKRTVYRVRRGTSQSSKRMQRQNRRARACAADRHFSLLHGVCGVASTTTTDRVKLEPDSNGRVATGADPRPQAHRPHERAPVWLWALACLANRPADATMTHDAHPAPRIVVWKRQTLKCDSRWKPSFRIRAQR